MLVFLTDLIDHQLGWRGLKEDFNRRLKFLLIGYLWIQLLNMIPPITYYTSHITHHTYLTSEE